MLDAKFIIESLGDYFDELRTSPVLTEKLGEVYARYRIAECLKCSSSFGKYAKKVARKYQSQVNWPGL